MICTSNEGSEPQSASSMALLYITLIGHNTHCTAIHIQSYPGYPYLSYPKPRLSKRSSERGVCFKNMVFSIKSQTLRQSRVHVFVCHMYMFNVGTQWYVIMYSVKCKGLQMPPSYIFFMYNSMYIARKVSFGLSEQFRLSEQPIKPLCPKVFG